MLVSVTLLRTAVAGLFRGKWWWFHPVTPSRVDRSEPAATLYEARFRRRRLEFLLALASAQASAAAKPKVVERMTALEKSAMAEFKGVKCIV